MSATATIMIRELKRFARARSRIVGSLSMPVIWLAILGIGFSSNITLPGFSFSYLQFLGPGIIGMNLLFTSIFSGISVIWEKQFGFLKEMLVAPISRTSIILGKVLGSALISLFTGGMVLIIAMALGAIPLAQLSILGLAASVALMFLVSVSFISVGLIIASRLDNMEGFQVIMSFLVMPLFFLSGAFFPLERVPLWMKALSHIDPLMYGVDGLRGALLGVSSFPVWLDLGVLAGCSAALILLAGRMFRKIG